VTILFFFHKEHILISWRYQLHPTSATTYCSNGITDAYRQKKKEIKKSVLLHWSIFWNNSTNTTKITKNSSFFKSDASKKRTVHKRLHRLFIDLRIFTLKKNSRSKK
jgi:hypothetical protein